MSKEQELEARIDKLQADLDTMRYPPQPDRTRVPPTDYSGLLSIPNEVIQRMADAVGDDQCAALVQDHAPNAVVRPRMSKATYEKAMALIEQIRALKARISA